MTYSEARQSFIEKWGNLGINWGFNRSLGQVHGLLLTACHPMCADEVMEILSISRGNVNMNVRVLMKWGLVEKVKVNENRKEFFIAEKDMWIVFRQIIKERRKKELDPLLESLEELASVNTSCQNSDEFKKMISSIEHFSKKVDNVLTHIVSEKPNIIVSTYMKM